MGKVSYCDGDVESGDGSVEFGGVQHRYSPVLWW